MIKESWLVNSNRLCRKISVCNLWWWKPILCTYIDHENHMQHFCWIVYCSWKSCYFFRNFKGYYHYFIHFRTKCYIPNLHSHIVPLSFSKISHSLILDTFFPDFAWCSDFQHSGWICYCFESHFLSVNKWLGFLENSTLFLPLTSSLNFYVIWIFYCGLQKISISTISFFKLL